jgi:phenylacetate-CoA ligase
MAMEMYRRGIRAEGLKLLRVGAEIIHENNRQLYRKQFGVEAIENYGSIEMGVVAYETQEHDGLHLCEDLTYFEFLDENGKPVRPAQVGRVVVTDLTATLMPLIRYDQSKYPGKTISNPDFKKLLMDSFASAAS